MAFGYLKRAIFADLRYIFRQVSLIMSLFMVWPHSRVGRPCGQTFKRLIMSETCQKMYLKSAKKAVFSVQLFSPPPSLGTERLIKICHLKDPL